jgi:hypothetical protein
MDLVDFEAKSTAILAVLRAFLTKKYAKSAAQASVAELISVSISRKR